MPWLTEMRRSISTTSSRTSRGCFSYFHMSSSPSHVSNGGPRLGQCTETTSDPERTSWDGHIGAQAPELDAISVLLTWTILSEDPAEETWRFDTSKSH